MPYLQLIEELQTRTTDGWSEAPLDAINSLVQKLDESSVKTELVTMVNRLTDHKLRRQAALSPTDEHCFLGVKFRSISIVPDKSELLVPSLRGDLPVNLVRKRYASTLDYLETHFLLLREDCIDPLRQGIRAYRNNQFSRELHIYQQVRLAGYRCGEEGIEYGVSFPIHGRRKDLESTKSLMFGALVCLSCDRFQHSFILGVVTRAGRYKVWIRVMKTTEVEGENVNLAPIASSKTYVMVESATAYFGAYYHVLRSLQRECMEIIPFQKYLLDLESQVDPPLYLLRGGGDELDFSSVFPDIKAQLGKSLIHVLQDWPSWSSTLDEAQLQALKHGLTKELSIIQGPPGTGKTFLGLLLVRLLLANFKAAGQDEASKDSSYWRKGPILIICMTNHALDQFLEGIYRFEKKLIRVGSRSKSKILKNRTLKEVKDHTRAKRGRQGQLAGHYAAKKTARFARTLVEWQIHHCIRKSNAERVTKDELIRLNVATKAQIENLFSVGLPSKDTVECWLAGDVLPRLKQVDLQNDELLQRIPKYDSESDEVYTKSTRGHSGRVVMFNRPVAFEDGWQAQRKTGRNWNGRKPDKPNYTNIIAQGGESELIDQTGAVDIEDTSPNNTPNVQGQQNMNTEAIVPSSESTLIDQIGAMVIGDTSPDDIQEVQEQPNMNTNVIAPEGELTLIDQVQAITIEDNLDFPNVWRLNQQQRGILHQYWLDEMRKIYASQLQELTREYESTCETVRQINDNINLTILRQANVVGITTTTAARYKEILKALNSEILIVEEAAEVLEGHVLAALSSCVKHLVLIGDHLQLRPSTAVYQLGTKYKLDVSMFERLLEGGVEQVVLQEQRRMRPSFSNLVRTLYPKLKDHESVSEYENIRGVNSNLLFFDHAAQENSTTGDSSKANTTEAKLVVGLALYLMKQDCYSAQDIVILTMYSGQILEITRIMKERAASRTELLPRVTSVDGFQGEEAHIIILSLVRSNSILTSEGKGTIGFLKTSNRICVALTRAKKGMYIFGNAALLAQRSNLWNHVISTMRNDNALDTKLELICQNHPETKTVITEEGDFKQVVDGGCSRPCEVQLDCGHFCPRRCHPGSHDGVVCHEPCSTPHSDCQHICTQMCHGSRDCPPCSVQVIKIFSECGHSQIMKCQTNPADEICRNPCPKVLECLHECASVCGLSCTVNCVQKVARDLPCGHRTMLPCCTNPQTYSCKEPCRAIIPGCGHQCQGNCGLCRNGTEHIHCLQKCGRILPCGHACEAGCSAPCPPCNKPCQKRCFHSECKLSCGQICLPCKKLCPWQCKHHQCDLLCHEICTRRRCNRPCKKLLTCGHSCIGLCGEPCPRKCRTCHPTNFDVITQRTLEGRFHQFQDCKHLFEVTELDTWMDSDDRETHTGRISAAVKLKECPQCKVPIWRSTRYGNVIKTRHAKVEEVKKKMLAYENTRQGLEELEKGNCKRALSLFVDALKQNPALLEAHFGAGTAACVGGTYACGAVFLSFVVEKSSYAAEVQSYLKGTNVHDGTLGASKADCSQAKDELAVKAMLQLASAFTAMGEFSSAEKLCDVVIRRYPGNQDAKTIKESANRGLIAEVVQMMSKDVGERGHWYECPNGHYYTIGECGVPTHQSKCPDCKADVPAAQACSG